MSRQNYQDDCPGCRPVVLDVIAKQVDEAMTAKVLEFWKTTTLVQRKAFHRFTCLNSRETEDLRIIARLRKQMEAIMP